MTQKFQALTDRKGIVAAIVDEKNTQIITFGAAKKNQIFEIGSLTKVFTGVLLAQEVVNEKIKLNDFIPNEYQKNNSNITYQNLATHTAGIIGGNFANYVSSNPESPYEGLTVPLFKKLYAQTPLVSSVGQKWIYSNIGVGLLGLILAENNKIPYNTMIEERIFKPLAMNDSYFNVPVDKLARFPKGNVNGQSFSHWDLYSTAISPAGGIRSTISDMAIFARANLITSSTSLVNGLQAAQQPLYDMGNGKTWMGMNWIIDHEKSLIWHNGSTIGFNSILVLSVKHRIAVVAMTDTGIFKTDSTGKTVMDESLQEAVFYCLK